MFDNEIKLLKKDILSRLGEDKTLYVDFEGEKCTICEVDYRGWVHLDNGAITGVVNLKPYLRPMSNMTEEEEDEINKYGWNLHKKGGDAWIVAEDKDDPLDYGGFRCNYVHNSDVAQISDWLDSNFFDWRGLIPLDLALEATEGMYK